jgi:hypothetical protein
MTRKFPIIVVNQSGRASDAMACFIKHHDNRKNSLKVWDDYLAKDCKSNEERQCFTEIMNQVRVNYLRVICVLFECLSVICVLFECLSVICVLFACHLRICILFVYYLSY